MSIMGVIINNKFDSGVFIMKKIILFLLIFALFIFSGCSDETKDWQTVKLGERESIKIPQNWVVSVIDDTMYFSDKPMTEKNPTVYMFQYNSEENNKNESENNKEKTDDKTEYNKLCKSFKVENNTEEIGKSNSATIITSVVSVDGKTQTVKGISLFYMDYSDIALSGERVFYVWNNNVSTELLYTIADTYDNYTYVE